MILKKSAELSKFLESTFLQYKFLDHFFVSCSERERFTDLKDFLGAISIIY
jgi:hypothetical protein